ncbi:MAG: hypothetical protein ABR600_11750 [Actinomycetota bacterium]
MSAAAIPPAPAPSIVVRGHHGSRVRWGRLLWIFSGVLVVVLVAAGVAVKLSAPAAPEPACPSFPCGSPPSPVAPPGSNAAPLLAGTPFHSSGLGYQLEYTPKYWKIEKQSASDVELHVSSAAILLLEGFSPAEGDVQDLVDRKVASLRENVVSLTENDERDDQVLGPAVGYRSGVLRLLQGTLDSPQGPGTPVDVVVMGASDQTATVVLTYVVAHKYQEFLFALLDNLMETFRFPSEVPR